MKTLLSFLKKLKAVSLRDKRKGYRWLNVTPYMHAMVYHIPTFFMKYKSVKLFTGQGVEKIMIVHAVWYFANPTNGMQQQMF